MMLRTILFFICLSFAELSSSQRYIHNVPEAMISLQSSDLGYLLCLSQSGKIYQFDGAEFVILQEGIKGAKSILRNDDHYIILSEEGVWRWSETLIQHQQLSEECYSYIAIGGKEYTLTETGLYSFVEGRYQLVNDWTADIDPNAKFYKLGKEYYMSNANTIYVYKSGYWKVLARDTFAINDMVQFLDAVWIATDDGLKKLKDRIIYKTDIEGIDSTFKIDYLFALNESLFIQTVDKLLEWDPSNRNISQVDYKSSSSEVVEDQWGDIWYADEGNIIQQKFDNAKLSIPIISNIDVSIGGEVQSGPEIIIEEEGIDVQITYDAIHLRQPQSIKFQSLLSPINKEYQEVTTDRNIVFTDIAAGKYTYRLRASVDGNQFAYSNPIKILVKAKDEVSPLWWILGASCLFLLFLALLSNYRLQAYKEKSSLLTSKLRTANDLLKSQQKTMQLQMNPHFLFNALNSIQGLVALNRNGEAKVYLQKFSRMMRSVLEFSTVEKIDLEQEINYLNDYLSIEQMTRSNSFTYDIIVKDDLLLDDIKIPPMILQPFIENAIIHGVASVKNGKISLEIREGDTQLLCTIKDNGVGRKIAMSKQTSTHKSVAVSLAQERLQSHTAIQNSIQYTDLSQGTQVDIQIPI